ncbi:MAG: hypothetical protein DMF69_19900 [Acidobacteria bacterium]|nr:MAG: hypothetical protein DMF69_19900 [Acidobacteriota bacterium]
MNATTLARMRKTISEAKPDDWRTPVQAGNWVTSNSITTDDAEGMAWIEQSIKIKSTFQNLSAKANALYRLGKKEEAFAVGEQAIQQGKTDKVNTAAFEKRLADMKAGKI